MAPVPAIALTVWTARYGDNHRGTAETVWGCEAQHHPKSSPVTQRLVGTPIATARNNSGDLAILHHLEHTLGLIVRGLRCPQFPIDGFGYRVVGQNC